MRHNVLFHYPFSLTTYIQFNELKSLKLSQGGQQSTPKELQANITHVAPHKNIQTSDKIKTCQIPRRQLHESLPINYFYRIFLKL